jgi:hypothetical protein
MAAKAIKVVIESQPHYCLDLEKCDVGYPNRSAFGFPPAERLMHLKAGLRERVFRANRRMGHSIGNGLRKPRQG